MKCNLAKRIVKLSVPTEAHLKAGVGEDLAELPQLPVEAGGVGAVQAGLAGALALRLGQGGHQVADLPAVRLQGGAAGHQPGVLPDLVQSNKRNV